MTKLSVNINKIATLRNARGGSIPNVVEAAKKIESFGGEGITVHPRPDERHITYRDVRELSTIVKTEFNIEGNPVAKFINLVMEAKPAQVTLVPDAEDAITSNAGWNTIKNKGFLQEVIQEFKNNGIRTSIFVDPDEKMVEGAAQTGTDRIELYTEDFAVKFAKGDQSGVEPYTKCAELAHQLGLGIIPLKQNNKVRYCAIDIDVVHPTNPLRHSLEELEQLIIKFELPLLVCRSKSGGIHLYCFFKEDASL